MSFSWAGQRVDENELQLECSGWCLSIVIIKSFKKVHGNMELKRSLFCFKKFLKPIHSFFFFLLYIFRDKKK